MEPLVLARRTKLAQLWKPLGRPVIVASGEPIHRPGRADQCYPFQAHTDYRWLTDKETAGAYVTYTPQEGFRDFVPTVSPLDYAWDGLVQEQGEPLATLEDWKKAHPEAATLGALRDAAGSEIARDLLLEARASKDEVELGRIRRAVEATRAGFAAAKDAIRPGASEREIQVELCAGFARAGGDAEGYAGIVGSGPHSCVFHFTPGDRRCIEGENVLIDAGAECEGYCADVTRTYPVGERTGRCADLFSLVYDVEQWAIGQCRPGQEWRALHLAASERIASGLVSLGLLRGEPSGLVECDAHALFFPHGLGHLVGLGVRDASRYLPGRSRSNRFGLAFLRMDMPLAAGMVTTIEPGIYFVPALLEDRYNREKFASHVSWEEVDNWMGIGGIRIEDDVLVTENEPENLTAGIDY